MFDCLMLHKDFARMKREQRRRLKLSLLVFSLCFRVLFLLCLRFSFEVQRPVCPLSKKHIQFSFILVPALKSETLAGLQLLIKYLSLTLASIVKQLFQRSRNICVKRLVNILFQLYGFSLIVHFYKQFQGAFILCISCGFTIETSEKVRAAASQRNPKSVHLV